MKTKTVSITICNSIVSFSIDGVKYQLPSGVGNVLDLERALLCEDSLGTDETIKILEMVKPAIDNRGVIHWDRLGDPPHWLTKNPSETDRNIPPKHFGCKMRYGWEDKGVTKALARLAVGESVTLSKKFWGCVRVISNRLEIKTVTRSLGSKDEVTVYRIA